MSSGLPLQPYDSITIVSCEQLFFGYSEPPDIKNWFSSYVYESPVPGTSSLFVDSVSEEHGCEEIGFNSENVNEHEVGFENVQPSESVKHNSCSDTNTKIKQPSSRVLILNLS